MSASRRRMLSVTASTKRRPTGTASRGEPATYLASIRVAPVMPNTDGNNVLIEGLQTFTEETDIKSGDVLVIGGIEYPVLDADPWPASTFDAPLVTLTLEDKKR